MIPLDRLNNLNQGPFVEAVGWVLEHSPWVSERAWARRPFHDWEALHQAMVQEVEAALPEMQLALLLAHPDLGTKSRMSNASASEQAGAGLETLPGEQFDLYKKKFGFPFIFAVKGSTRQDILRALEKRLLSTREVEFAEALQQVYRIAWFRLHDKT